MSSATHINHSSHSGSTTGTAHRSQPTTQACAACKYQRRKCNPDCTLAPYFPADHQRQFLNAHRLFGVSNILKIIRNLDPLQRSEAMRSIIFQSNARAHDPVGGCYRIILELQRQYERDSAELAIVLRQLAFYRAQAQTHGLPPDLDPAAIQSAPILNLDADDATYAANPHNLDPAMHQQQQQQQYYNYFYFDEGGGGGGDNNNNNNNNNSSNSNSNSINNYNNNNNNNNNNSNVVEMEMTQSMLSLQQQCGVAADDDVKPLVDMFDDEVKPLLEFTMGNQEEDHKDASAAAVSSTGGYHCSNRMELKEDANLMEHVQEHDLKGAASLFTLTNCHASSL